MRDDQWEDGDSEGPSESQIQEMLACREEYDRTRFYEKRLDPRSRDYWSDRIDEAMDQEEAER